MERKERDPSQLTAADVEVGLLQVTDKDVKLRLWPKAERVRAALNEVYMQDCWSTDLFTVAGKTCCRLLVTDFDNVEAASVHHAALCPTEYRMMTDQARNETDGALIMAASYLGIGAAVIQLPVMVVRNDQVQINPVPDASGKRIARYTLADTLTPANLVYDDAGHIIEVDFTRRDGGVIKWQKR